MSVREKLNENPLLGIAAGLLVTAAAAWVLYSTMTDRGGTADLPQFYYYTSDDGKSYFSVSADEVPPIMKDGKEAVRARIYSCDSGKTTSFTFLEKYKDDFKKQVDAEKAKPQDPNAKGPRGVAALLSGSGAAFARLIKKPGDQNWVPAVSNEGGKVQQMRCPSGDPLDLAERLPKSGSSVLAKD